MKTPTHAIAGWLMARYLKLPASGSKAIVLGATLPDGPVIVVGIAVFALCHAKGRPDLFKPLMDAVYFGETSLREGHSFLHSPANLVLVAVGVCLMHPFYRRLSEWMACFAIGAASHALLDILTHVEDAPLMLWPFSREFRWPGPVSHWDHRYYGDVISIAEFCLWTAGAVFVGVTAKRRFMTRRVR